MDKVTWGAMLRDSMRLAQAGDQMAYGRLLHEILPWIQRYVRIQQPFLAADTVDDVTQDVLVSLHAVRATYDPSRPFIPWLKSIVRNRVVDEARRYYRRTRIEIKVDTLPETSLVDGANPTHELYEDKIILKRAIKMLPPRQRQAIDLLKIRQLSLIEAERESGIPITSLKVAVHRAIKSLRKIMDDGDRS